MLAHEAKTSKSVLQFTYSKPEALNDPAFSIGSVVKAIDNSRTSNEWFVHEIVALRLVKGKSPLYADKWMYGVECSLLDEGVFWYEEFDIVEAKQAHLYNFEPEF